MGFFLKRYTILVVFIGVFLFFYQGQALSKELGEEYFKTLFFHLLQKNLPWAKENLRITKFVVEPKSIILPQEFKEKVHLKHRLIPGANTLLIDYFQGERLLCRVKILAYVEVMMPVVVLKRPLARGMIIHFEDLALERRSLNRLPKDVILKPEEALGLQAKVSIPAGKPLRKSYLESPPVIKRGSLVRIIAEGKNFRVTALGEARQPGRPGEIIRVRNLASKKDVFAKVLDSQTVKVTF